MEPRLIAGIVKSKYPGFLSQPSNLMVGMIVSDYHPYLCSEECRRALVPYTRTMSHSVKFQDADKILSDRNQSRLAELRFPNHECGIPEIRILMR